MKKQITSNMFYIFLAAPIVYTANGIRLHIQNLEVSNYALSEFLINYQGGFVRRGLIGEIAFNSSDPVYMVTLLQKSSLVFVLVGLLAILFFEKSNLARLVFTVILLFGPGGLHDMKLGGSSVSGFFEYLDRKEIWFYSALILMYFLNRFAGDKPMIFYPLFSLVCLLTILIHELFVIFPIAILAVLFISKKITFKSLEFFGIILSSLVVMITLLLVTPKHGTEEISNKITSSYAVKFPSLDIDGILSPTENAIFAIGWPISRSHELASRLFTEGSAIYYLYFLALGLFALFVYAVIKFEKRTHLLVALLLSAMILTGLTLIVYVFLDAGRLISMFTIGMLICFNILGDIFRKAAESKNLRHQDSKSIDSKTQRNLILLATMAYVFFVGSITRVEHSNPQPNQIPLKSFLGIVD
jgi:hypothetical protein